MGKSFAIYELVDLEILNASVRQSEKRQSARYPLRTASMKSMYGGSTPFWRISMTICPRW
jgi:hypothetical protein